MKQRVLSILFVLALLCGIMLVIAPMQTNAETSGDWLYTVSNEEAMITGYYGNSATVNVPTTLGGYPVTRIGNHAFEDCSFLTSITIPDGVTSIGDAAFLHCDSLTSVELPDSVTSIGVFAFSSCTSLKNVKIPNSVTNIEFGAFCFCKSLESIVIPDSVTSVGDCAFEGCASLASVMIPDSVTSVGNSAFGGCASLASVMIPDSVTSIGEGAFLYCTSLKSVEISANVTSIGDQVFSGCSLTSIEVDPENPAYYSESNCIIERETKKLIAVGSDGIIPGGVTSIGEYVFSGCTMKNIEIPNSVTNIESGAFFFCESLESIVIPDSVTSVGDSAFYRCASLASVMIPDSVTSIGNEAFSYCKSLTDIYCQAKSKPSGWDNNWMSRSTATVHWGYCPHNELQETRVEATCTENGYVKITCESCGTLLSYNEILAIGHVTETVYIRPTCTEEGYSGTVCKICQASIEKTEVQPALGHTFETIEKTEPTCTEKGFIKQRCSVCEEETAEQIAALGHNQVTGYDPEPSCDEAGYYKTKCSRCSEVFSSTIYLALGHQFSGKTCSVCGFEPKVSPAGGDIDHDGEAGAFDYMMLKRHILGTYKIAERDHLQADLDGNGALETMDYMILKRAVLGTYQLKPACKHEAFDVAGVEATCTETGKTQGTMCKLCGSVLSGWDVTAIVPHKLSYGVCIYCNEAFDAYSRLYNMILKNGEANSNPTKILWLATITSNKNGTTTLSFWADTNTRTISISTIFMTQKATYHTSIDIDRNLTKSQVSLIFMPDGLSDAFCMGYIYNNDTDYIYNFMSDYPSYSQQASLLKGMLQSSVSMTLATADMFFISENMGMLTSDFGFSGY